MAGSLSLALALTNANLFAGGGVVPTITLAEFIDLMTADGQWATLDAAHVYDPAAAPYTDLSAGGHNLTVTPTVTQVPGLGAKGDGVAGKLLGLGALNALVNGTQNDIAVTFMITKAGNQIGHMGRVAAAGQLTLTLGPVDVVVRLQTATTPASSFAVSNSVGAITLWRTASGTVEAAKDGVYLGSIASVSATPTASPIAIMQNNATFSTDTIFATLVGKGITQAQALRRNGWLIQLARGRGWRPIPAIQNMGTLTATVSLTHPDQTELVPTGLWSDGAAGVWCGNDGRTDELDTTFNGGVRHYPDATNLATYTDFRLNVGALATHFSGLGISTTTLSVQGGCRLASGQIQFVAKDTVGTNSRVVRMDADGTNVSSWATSSGANGLCFDPVEGLVGLMGSTFISWRAPTTGVLTARTGGSDLTSTQGLKDHATITDDGQWMLTVGGPNNAPAILTIWSLVNEWGCPVPVRQALLGNTLAGEGPCIIAAGLAANSDTGFHEPDLPGPQVSEMNVYPTTGMFAAF